MVKWKKIVKLLGYLYIFSITLLSAWWRTVELRNGIFEIGSAVSAVWFDMLIVL